MGLGSLLVSMLLPIPAAQANTFRCGSSGINPNDRCAKVIGIDPGSYLGVRTGPHYSARTIGKAYNGYTLELVCWTTGDGAADNPSYKIWDKIAPADVSAYVSDWYVDSGHVQSQIPHC